MKEQVAWTAAEASVAFLARDVNKDGRITSGKELFGVGTIPESKNGIHALSQVLERSSSPPAGEVRAGHALYEELLLWVDRNHDGRGRPGLQTRHISGWWSICNLQPVDLHRQSAIRRSAICNLRSARARCCLLERIRK